MQLIFLSHTTSRQIITIGIVPNHPVKIYSSVLGSPCPTSDRPPLIELVLLLEASLINDLVSGSRAAYDRADKLRTCNVYACNETIILIRAEQMSVLSKQLQTVSIREFFSLWRQTEHGERDPLRQGCLIWCQHQLCTDILTTVGKCT